MYKSGNEASSLHSYTISPIVWIHHVWCFYILSYTFGLYDNLMFVNIHYLKYKFGKDQRYQKFEGKQSLKIDDSCFADKGIRLDNTQVRLKVTKPIIQKGVGKDCHFCEHWAFYHKDNLQDMSCIEIYFLDSCEDPGPAEEDYPLLRKLEEKHMVNMGSLASLDPVQGCNERDDARARPWVRTGGN